MLKKFAAAGVVMAFLGGIVLAAEYEGTLKGIDTEKKTIKIKVKGADEEKTFKYGTAVKFEGKVGRKGDAVEASADALSKHLESKGGKRGVRVKITTEGEGAKEVITNVKVVARKKKKGADTE